MSNKVHLSELCFLLHLLVSYVGKQCYQDKVVSDAAKVSMEMFPVLAIFKSFV